MKKIFYGLMASTIILLAFNNCAPKQPPSLLANSNAESNGLNELCGKIAANSSPARSRFNCNDDYCIDCSTGEYFENKMTNAPE